MAKEYIEREAAYRFAQDQMKKETGAYSKGWNNALNVMKSAFHNNDAIPAAEVVERKLGAWIWDDEGYHCSECFFHANGCTCEILSGYYHFCPHCGAAMREDTT